AAQSHALQRLAVSTRNDGITGTSYAFSSPPNRLQASHEPTGDTVMKLAEALLLRNEMQTKLTSLTGRIVANAMVQEGDQPQEDPLTLIRQVDDLLAERQTLVERINATNQQAGVDDQRTVAQAITQRDRLTKMH